MSYDMSCDMSRDKSHDMSRDSVLEHTMKQGHPVCQQMRHSYFCF